MRFSTCVHPCVCVRAHWLVACLHACTFYVSMCVREVSEQSWIRRAVYSVHYKARRCLQQYIYATPQLASLGFPQSATATAKQDLQQRLVPSVSPSRSVFWKLSLKNVSREKVLEICSGTLNSNPTSQVFSNSRYRYLNICTFLYECNPTVLEDLLIRLWSSHPQRPYVLVRKPPSENVSCSLCFCLRFWRKLCFLCHGGLLQSVSSRLWFRVWAETTFGWKTWRYSPFFHSDHETVVENTRTQSRCAHNVHSPV